MRGQIEAFVADTEAFRPRVGEHRELRQGIVYRAGVAVEYRCPECGELHPLDRRDWDEARGHYAGRFCGRDLRIVTRRAKNAEEKRRYYAATPEYREREKARVAAARKKADGAATVARNNAGGH